MIYIKLPEEKIKVIYSGVGEEFKNYESVNYESGIMLDVEPRNIICQKNLFCILARLSREKILLGLIKGI